ncbi:phosphotriesterase-related protein [Vibrio sp. SS-MA-C1-2]|uniref:phosphotriesterase family protein n=1 Tax=Vibrio sp. SS-MA-C1-2 TaxID=2908646 RepID=UPI001F21BA5C|nr:phosphotriesterase-related protein [Vibrio sp. SS-MA-C1-2]UJF17032.1 phosphotriesterase-related protein [Vibrio sp. SS-MA-C1-2]
MPLDQAGYTYCHEHLYIDLSSQKQDEDCKLDQFENIRNELDFLHSLGVRNIIEVTNHFMGRNPHFIEDLIKETNINIISSTGFYIEGFFPQSLDAMSSVDIANVMMEEINVGIGGSSLKAEVIGEIGSSLNHFSDLEKKVFEGAAIAQRETGCPISTHTSLSTMGRQQVELLAKNRVDLTRVSIGHCDLKDDFDQLLWLLDQGCKIQFDTIGKNSYYPDEKRIQSIIKLVERGYINQIMLSMDITRRSHLLANGGKGFSYLMTDFIPKLRQAGLNQKQIEIIMQENPNQFFIK